MTPPSILGDFVVWKSVAAGGGVWLFGATNHGGGYFAARFYVSCAGSGPA